MKSDVKLNPNPSNDSAPICNDSRKAAAVRNELIWNDSIDRACTWETNNDGTYRDNSERRSGRRDNHSRGPSQGITRCSKSGRTFCMRNSAMQIVTRLFGAYQRGSIAILSQDVIPARHRRPPTNNQRRRRSMLSFAAATELPLGR